MAKLLPIHRLTLNDIPGAPSWVDRLLYLLNQIIQSLYSALNGGLTLTDNLGAQIKDFEITAGVAATNNTFKFPFTTKNRPVGVIPLSVQQVASVYTPVSSAFSVSWHLEGENVVIDAIPGLTSTKIYKISVLVI